MTDLNRKADVLSPSDAKPAAVPRLNAHELQLLRSEHYNAEVADIQRIHDDLMVVRIRPDCPDLHFVAGQYTVLGLGYWEDRAPDTQAEHIDEGELRKVARRAYSVSCPLIDANGEIAVADASPWLEFYIVLIRHAGASPPALTPRLFALAKGDRLFMSTHFHGNHTLRTTRLNDTVIFVATGTGEAPHNAMIASLLSSGHRGPIVAVCCVRYERDLAYRQQHRQLENRYPNYRYIARTTREPMNVDPQVSDYIGKQYLQEYFASGDFQRETGVELSPETASVYLCGNPEMIGVPHHTHNPALRYPKPTGMVEVLEKQGFHVDRPHQPGNILSLIHI